MAIKSEKEVKRRSRSREGGWRYMKGNLYARLQYTDETGKQREKLRRVPTGKKSDVWTAVRSMKDELLEHGEETLNSDKMTIEDLAELYKKAQVFPAIIKHGNKVAGLKSYKPIETYVRIVVRYFGKKKIREIRPRHIEKFRIDRLNTPVEIEIKQRERVYNPATKRMKIQFVKEKRITSRKLSSVNREMATLRRMLNYGKTQGWLLSNPFDKTERLVSTASERARDRVLEFDEEKRLLDVCIHEREHLRPILICALDTAMRPEEIFKLRWSDVDFQRGIFIIRAENTKTETERIVGITSRLRTEIEKVWARGPQVLSDSVFGVKSIKNAFKTACRLASVTGFTFRDCRHTATTRMVNSGMPQAEIMKVTGHTQLKTFLRYVNLTTQTASDNAGRLGEYVQRKFESFEAALATSTSIN